MEHFWKWNTAQLLIYKYQTYQGILANPNKMHLKSKFNNFLSISWHILATKTTNFIFFNLSLNLCLKQLNSIGFHFHIFGIHETAKFKLMCLYTRARQKGILLMKSQLLMMRCPYKSWLIWTSIDCKKGFEWNKQSFDSWHLFIFK